jgi:uncharacterized protein
MKILITGATGFIGQELGKALVRDGHEITAISRNRKKAEMRLSFPAHILELDLEKTSPNPDSLKEIEAVIHLAGENVGEGRWSRDRKRHILDSRVHSTKNLIDGLPASLQVFVASSAVGFYGDRGDETLTEASQAGAGFLSEVCQKWEVAVQTGLQKFSHTRCVIFRTGVVFGPYGGALMRMLPAFQVGLGGMLGPGRQWMSWIHLQDAVELFREAVKQPKMSGVFNAVAPEAITNQQFTKELARQLGVRQGPAVPAVALKLLLGEMASMALDSQRVQSERLQGFSFRFPTLEQALQDCCAPYREGDQIFYSEQFFPMSIDRVFSFFSKAQNLEQITPPSLNFHILSMSTPEIAKGTLIDYRLKIRGVPVGWQTLIEDWQPNGFFRDLQTKGPYQKWDHTHRFEELGGGTLMRDLVRYRLPLGPAGKLVSNFVRRDIESIFQFRRENVSHKL